MSANISVRNEAGHRGIAHQISGIVDEMAPRVEKYTGLEVAGTVRLVTPDVWASAVMAHANWSLARATTTKERASAAQAGELWGRRSRWLWAQYPGITVMTQDGQPQTVIVPEALKHTGLRRTNQGLIRFVTRQCVLLAQYSASQGAVVPPPIAARSDSFGDPERGIDALSNGHADWAEQLASADLLGQLTPEHPRPSRYARRQVARVPRRNALAVRSAQLLHRPTPLPVQQPDLGTPAAGWAFDPASVAFVSITTDFVGLAQWNRIVWGNPRWTPDSDEIQAPHTWLRRVGLAAHTG